MSKHSVVVVAVVDEDLDQRINASRALTWAESTQTRSEDLRARVGTILPLLTAPAQESDPEVSPPGTLLTFAMRNNA
jgi:hypothetical protein